MTKNEQFCLLPLIPSVISFADFTTDRRKQSFCRFGFLMHQDSAKKKPLSDSLCLLIVSASRRQFYVRAEGPAASSLADHSSPAHLPGRTA